MSGDDRDFYYAQNQKPRPSLLAYLAVALIGAVIGGFIVASAIPELIKNEAKLNSPNITQSLPPIASTGDSPAVRIAETVGPTVVGISNRVDVNSFFAHQNIEQGTGSGVVFDANGYIVTNYHVIQSSDQIIVTLPNGKKVNGKVVGTDQRTDLAVVKVEEKGLKAAIFGDSDKIRVGELAVAIGNPLGEELASTLTAGVISAINRSVDVEEQRFRLIQTDAAINPGNSGGALVNFRGEVIGINSIKIVDVNVEGLNFAIPSNTVKPIVESIIKNGKVIRPWIGILGGDVNPDIAEQYNLSSDTGVFVSELPSGSPAGKAGLKSGDVIVSINGQIVKSFVDLRAALDKQKVGDKVEVIVQRGKNAQTFNIILEQMPQQ
jgi:serine protease Do